MKKPPLFPIFLIVLVDILGYTLMMPLLPFYAQELGASPLGVGFLLASYGFCQMLAGPVLGRFSDHVGRRPVLIYSQLGTFASFILMALAWDIKILFAARVVDGLTAGNIAVAQAYIADATEPEKRTRAFGIIGVSYGLGFLIGPAISGFLSPYGHHAPIVAAAALSFLSLVFTIFLLPKKEPAHIPAESGLDFSIYKKLFRDPVLGSFLRQFLFFVFAFSLIISGFALFAERRFLFDGRPPGAREIGYIFAYAGLLGLIIHSSLIGPLAKKFGEKNLIRAGFLFMFSGFFALTFVKNIPFLLIVLTIGFAGSSILRPSLTSLITQQSGPRLQGSVLGVTQSLMSFSQVIAPVTSGFLIQHGHLSAWAFLAALSAFLGILQTRSSRS